MADTEWLKAALQRRAEQIDAVRALHAEHCHDEHGHGFCEADGFDYPCPTIRALHDAGLLADPADRDANTRVAARNALEWRMVARKNEARAERAEAERDHAQEVAELAEKDRRTYHRDAIRAEAEVARLTARLGDCHCDLNPATAKGAEVADLREWRRKTLDVMGYDDTPEYAEELLTYLPVWKAEGEADREHITELRATIARVRALHTRCHTPGWPDTCDEEDFDWPCRTIRALDGVGEQPEQPDPWPDPWGGANLAQCGDPYCGCGHYGEDIDTAGG